MRICEVTDISNEKLVALGQFLMGRAGDTGSKKKISIDAFVNLAQSMGVNISADQIRDIADKPPLNNIIVNVTDNEIVFAGAGNDSQVTDTMTVKQAQDTVEKMAKRALD
jgi:hypothetical protein